MTQELQVFTNSEDITARLAIFYRLHALRARSTKSSIDHPDYFSAPRHRLFIESMLAGLHADGEHQIHLFCLIVNEEIVAIRMGFLSGTDLYFYYSGYEPAYSRFSVMTTLVAESLQWCITRGITRVNLSVGTDVSKTRWGPDVATYQEAIFVNRGFQKNVVAHLIYLTKLKRAVRKMSAGLVTALRNNHPRTKDQVAPTIK